MVHGTTNVKEKLQISFSICYNWQSMALYLPIFLFGYVRRAEQPGQRSGLALGYGLEVRFSHPGWCKRHRFSKPLTSSLQLMQRRV
jgi:hypothetical protein